MGELQSNNIRQRYIARVIHSIIPQHFSCKWKPVEPPKIQWITIGSIIRLWDNITLCRPIVLIPTPIVENQPQRVFRCLLVHRHAGSHPSVHEDRGVGLQPER